MIKRIKKILSLSAVLSIIFSPLAALALTMPNKPAGVPDDIEKVLTNVISGVIGFIVIVAVLFLVWGGIQYLTSAGDETQVENAKKTISYAIIGLFVAAIAFAVVKLMVSWLNVT